ncbi:hypothetical protein ACVDFE_00155 [Lentzea chajnantorensis]
MTTSFDRENTREAAFIALRNWAEHDDQAQTQRSSLMAIAWRADAQDAAQLAAAADVPLHVVFEDLRRHGIEPDADPLAAAAAHGQEILDVVTSLLAPAHLQDPAEVQRRTALLGEIAASASAAARAVQQVQHEG